MNLLQVPAGPATLPEMLSAVREFATANYDKEGWDFVVEAMDTEELTSIIGTSKSRKSAITEVRRVARLLNGQRSEVQATAF